MSKCIFWFIKSCANWNECIVFNSGIRNDAFSMLCYGCDRGSWTTCFELCKYSLEEQLPKSEKSQALWAFDSLDAITHNDKSNNIARCVCSFEKCAHLPHGMNVALNSLVHYN